MPGGPSSCMASRALPSSYDRESMRVYAGEEEEDREEAEEEPHPVINGVRSSSSKSKNKNKNEKKNKKKKMMVVVDSPLYEGEGEGEHEDPDSLISPVIGRDLSINCLLHLSCSDYGAVASLNRSFRSLLQSGELYRLRRQSGAVEHWVFFSCNVLEWDAFDPFRRRWIAAAVPKMPPLECFMFCDKESLAVGTDLLVFGKDMTSCIVLRYSILTNSWSKGVAMHSPRCLFGSASSGPTAVVAGGIDTGGRIVNSAEMYHADRQCWEPLPSMNRARKMCSGVFMDGKFYVIGGMRSHTEHLTCAEEFDLERRTWRLVPGMAAGLARATTGAPPLVAVVSNELYAADYASNELRKYDKGRNAWATLGKLPERSVSMNGWGLAFKACGDRLIVIGGRGGRGISAGAGGVIELNSWVPTPAGPPEWEVIASRQSGSFVYNCAVMVC